MARVRKSAQDELLKDELLKDEPGKDEMIEMENALQEEDAFVREPGQTVVSLDTVALDENPKPSARPARRMGGHSGGDFDGGGKGPAIGDTHASDEEEADHYGSREETQAALEGKIASQNTLRLHQY
jgi:hypothetical protein